MLENLLRALVPQKTRSFLNKGWVSTLLTVIGAAAVAVMPTTTNPQLIEGSPWASFIVLMLQRVAATDTNDSGNAPADVALPEKSDP